MSKYLVVAAVLALAACGSKQAETPAADPAAAAAAAPEATTADTTKVAGDTAKAH